MNFYLTPSDPIPNKINYTSGTANGAELQLACNCNNYLERALAYHVKLWTPISTSHSNISETAEKSSITSTKQHMHTLQSTHTQARFSPEKNPRATPGCSPDGSRTWRDPAQLEVLPLCCERFRF